MNRPADSDGTPRSETEALLHELQVHQLELEMQNETLRQSQIALEESRDRYVDFYDFSPVGYVTLDDGGLIAEINLTGAGMLGRERASLLRRRFSPFVAAADTERWHRHFSSALQQDGKLDGELTVQRADGTQIALRADSLRLARPGMAPLLRLVLTDITESRRAAVRLQEVQAQLLQAAKMAALGQLAAGVAHEINNPVSYIHSNFGTLRAYVDDLLHMVQGYRHSVESGALVAGKIPDLPHRPRTTDLDYLRDDAKALIAESLHGLDRVARIVHDLLQFSHADDGQWQAVELHACLEASLSVIWNDIKYKVNLVKDYGSLPAIIALPAQLSQVFMNLLLNAAQAIVDHGTVTLRTGREGDGVWIEIEDTGAGIAADVLPRVFEPFFTTKPVGFGSGLGMSIAHGIIASHRGRIEVQSEVDRGTCVRVWLPIEPQAVEPQAVAPSPSRPPP